MNAILRPLAVVTGASSGIGFQLARICADYGFDLVIAADGDMLRASDQLAASGAIVEALQVELSTEEGVEEVLDLIGGRPVAALLANSGHGLGGAFLDQDWDEARDVIDTNITGTLYLVQQVARRMVARGEGKILITGSVAGFTPGTFQAIYSASAAFIDSFSWALRNELKDTGVTVTCLMPGATDTDFFARIGFEAMMAGKGDVIPGAMNKFDAALAHITPSSVLAESHRRGAEPLGPR
ncbi:MAG: SDR family NAD(P)-dependent oxidoreductase [Usitatibacter sp.]